MNYYRNIDKSKFNVDFVTTKCDDKILDEIENNGNKVFILPYRRKKPFTYIKELKKIVKENQYDIVHAHGSSSLLLLEMLAAKMGKCKIRIAHSRNTKSDHPLIHKILYPFFKRSYTAAFAVGEDAGKWLFKEKEFFILKNAQDINKYCYNEKIRKEMRAKYNIDSDIVLGCVGNFNEQKNHTYLLDIFSLLLNKKNNENYKLVLIGDGPLKNEIVEKAKKLNVYENIIFTGSSNEVSKWLQACDIMLLTSKFEGFPNVLIEWQIAGLPCIISDKITKHVKITNLVKFQSIDDSPQYWVNTIKNIKIIDRNLNMESLIDDITKNGFNITENVKQLEKKYEKLYKQYK